MYIYIYIHIICSKLRSKPSFEIFSSSHWRACFCSIVNLIYTYVYSESQKKRHFAILTFWVLDIYCATEIFIYSAAGKKISTDTYIHIYMYFSMHIYVYIHICVCIYICVYKYMEIYMYNYI